MNFAIGVCGDARFMRYENYRLAGFLQLVEQRHDVLTGRGIEIAGRFIGEQNARFCDQRPRDRDPLTLPALHFNGPVPGTVGQPDLFEGTIGARQPFFAAEPGIDQWHLNVVQRVGAV